jgi:Fic family protein
VSVGSNEHAFIPFPLPPQWEFPPSLWPSLSEAKSLMSLLEGIGRTLPNPGLLLRPLADREAIQSSKIEGTYATAKELLLFEMSDGEAKPGEEKRNEWREVLNYRNALESGTQSELPLSLRLLLELHKILMTGVRGKDRTPGEFRRVQVAIGTEQNPRFVPPPPHRLMECLDPLEKHIHAPLQNDPLVDCFLVHYQFEAIHPFADGNGRVGRLLLAIMVQRKCGLTKPWLYFSDFFERNLDEYIQRLFDVSTKAAWTEWVEFCIRATSSQAAQTIQRCENLRSIREDFLERLKTVGGAGRLNQMVEDLFHSPFLQVANLSKRLRVTYPTAKADVQRLVAADILRELPEVSPKTFYSPEVFKVAYGGIDET